MTDTELVYAAREHDSEAWRSLYERYLPLVWRYAYTLVGEVHLAEDVVSESLLALLKNIHQLDAEAPRIAGWLRSVVRNKVADHHRRTYRAADRLSKMGYDRCQDPPSASPSQVLETDETCNQVLQVLEELPERQRLVLEWKYNEGLKVREIADRLGETEKSVEASLYRARREFRRRYELAENAPASIGKCRSAAPSSPSEELEPPLH